MAPGPAPGLDSVNRRSAGASWTAHLLIFGLALLSRLVFQAEIAGFHTPPRDDAALYDSIAVSLVLGGDYVDAEGFRSRRAPAFPILLTGVYGVWGHSWAAARVVQAVLGAAACSILLALGVSYLSTATGLLAALACALFPYTIFWSGSLISEPLCTLLTVASIGALVRSNGSLRWTVAWSALAALTALTRPNMGLVFLLGLAWILARGGSRTMQRALAAIFTFVLVLIPWTIRNYSVHGRFVPITTMGGVVLWQGNNPVVASTPDLRGRSLPGDLTRADPAAAFGEAESDRQFFLKALGFMRERAADMPGLIAWKLVRLWNPFPQLESAWQKRIATVTMLPVFGLFGIGLVMAWRNQDRRVLPFLIPILAVTLTGALYWADARIRAPADPLILLVAAYGFESMLLRVRASRRAGRLLL